MSFIPVQTSVLSVIYGKDELGETYTFKFATPGVPNLVLRPAMLQGETGWDTSPYFDKAVGIAQSKNAKEALTSSASLAAIKSAVDMREFGQPLSVVDFKTQSANLYEEVKGNLREQKSRERYMLVQEISDRWGPYKHRVFVTLNKNQRMDQKLIERHERITCEKLNLTPGRAITVGVYKL